MAFKWSLMEEKLPKDETVQQLQVMGYQDKLRMGANSSISVNFLTGLYSIYLRPQSTTNFFTANKAMYNTTIDGMVEHKIFPRVNSGCCNFYDKEFYFSSLCFMTCYIQ